MKTDWIFEPPIDFEHKQYKLLSFVQKTKKDFEEYKLYPSFQQITLHLANLNIFSSTGEYMDTSMPLDPDDEILISEIVYHKVKGLTLDEYITVDEIVNFSKEEVTNLFMLGKSLWEVINDSISLKVIKNMELMSTGNGYFKLIYDNKLYVYEYKIKYSTPGDINSHKCYINKIYEGEKKGLHKILLNYTTFQHPEVKKNELVKLLPQFEILQNRRFPLSEAVVPISRRKIMNYVLQTVKINQI